MLKNTNNLPFTFIDLFAGIGAFRLALERSNCKCVFSSEWDPHSQKTYAANFGDTPRGDITKIAEQDIPSFDILCAGFPCQPFSSIGKREGFEHKTQGTLFYDVLRIIKHHKPKAFILENVKGLTTHEKGRTLRTIIASLAVSENGVKPLFPNDESLNYHVHWKILNARDYGVPQKRERIFIVGFSAELFTSAFKFPNPLEQKVNVGDIVEYGIKGYNISKHLQKSYLFKKDDGRPELIDKSSTGSVKTLCASYHKIQRLTGTFVKDPQVETGIRLLSERECKAIMGFPKDFQIPVSRTQMYRQMGNSIAVPVAEHVGKSVVEKVRNELSANTALKNHNQMYSFDDSKYLRGLFEQKNIHNLTYGSLGDKLGDVFEEYVSKILEDPDLQRTNTNNHRLDDDTFGKIKRSFEIDRIHKAQNLIVPSKDNGGNPKTDCAYKINNTFDAKFSIKQSTASSVTVAEFDANTIIQAIGLKDTTTISLMKKHQSDASAVNFTKEEKEKLTSGLSGFKDKLVSWCLTGTTSPETSTDLRHSNRLVFFKMGMAYTQKNWIPGQEQDLALISINVFPLDEYTKCLGKSGFGTGLSWTYATSSKGQKIQFKSKVI